MIYTNLIDPDMKWRIDKFDEELQKHLDDKNFVDDVRADFYIDDVDKSNDAAHGDGSNSPNNDAYGDIMMEDLPEDYAIDDTFYDKYISAEIIIDFPKEVPRREIFIRNVEDLDGTKVGTDHQNLLVDTKE